MPIDKPKHPNKFPAEFHLALISDSGTFLTAISDSRKACKTEARRFRCFLKSLAEYPLHHSSVAIEGKEVGTRIKPMLEGRFGLYVSVNKKIDWEAAIQP